MSNPYNASQCLATKPTVILDTNSVHSSGSIKDLLGNRNGLRKLADCANILVPEVVVDEVVAQKRRTLKEDIGRLRRSVVFKHLKYDTTPLDQFDVEAALGALRDDDSIAFKILPMPKDELAFSCVYGWAINNNAPFEKGCDKGFKDACIAVSVDRYISQMANSDDVLYFVTNDERLSEHFEEKGRLRVAKSIDDAIADIVKVSQPKSDDGRRTKSGEKVCPEINGCPKSLVPPVETYYLCNDLAGSRSFEQTHNTIAKLAPYAKVLDQTDVYRLFDALVANDQISWIANDPDVHNFYVELYDKVHEGLDDDVYARTVEIFGLSDEREAQRGRPILTQKDKDAFAGFVGALEAHVKGIDSSCVYEDDADKIAESLRAIINERPFDTRLNNIGPIVRVLVNGPAEYDSLWVLLKTIQDFCEMLENATPRKKEMIVHNLQVHLREIGDIIPF